MPSDRVPQLLQVAVFDSLKSRFQPGFAIQRAGESDALGVTFRNSGSNQFQSPLRSSCVEVRNGRSDHDAKGRQHDCNQDQVTAAVAAAEKFARRFVRLRCVATAQPVRPAKVQPHQPADVGQLVPRVGTHPAVVPDLLESLRQDVLQEASHKLVPRDGACA